MPGRLSRDKGARIEREIVSRHLLMGVHAEKVPLSGQSAYRDGVDVDIYPWGRDREPLVAEVKARASGGGFRMLERWLSNADLLILRRDRAEPLICLPWRTWARLLAR